MKTNFLLTKLLVMMLLFVAIGVYGEKTVYSDNWGAQGLTLKAQDNSYVVLNYSLTSFVMDNLEAEGESGKVLQVPGIFLPNDAGAPNLPGMSRYIAIPQGSVAAIKVVGFRTEVIEGIDIAPSPELPLDTDTGPLHYERNAAIYGQNAYYPAEPVKLSEPMQIRGLDVVLVGITPFQYNPVTRELIIYKDIEIEVTTSGGNGQYGDIRLRSRWWDPIMQDAVLNPDVLPEIDYSKRYESIDPAENTDYEYVIITPADPVFQAWADSIKIWRQLQGIRTGVFTTTEVGGNTTTAIESFINNAYNTWTIPPAACLLLGDFGSTGSTIISPIYNNYCASDNIYADVNSDHMPDVVFARMTAQNATHLETMVTKFLDHERTPPTNPGYYNNPITALGWQTERWFQICSETVGGFWKHVQGKTPVRINEIYSGTPGTVWSSNQNTYMVTDYFGPNGLGYIPATPAELGGWSGGNATMINNAINSGAFMLQHRDHGSTTGWGEPSYNSSNIDGLTNTDLVFVFSINCLTGKYNLSGECFTEKFHRYTYGGHNSGALGLIAASETSYSFVNDTYVWGMMDNMWTNFMPSYGTTPPSRDVLPAFGNAAGKYFLQQSNWPYNTSNKEVTYHLFHLHGDAFMTVYCEVPQNLTVLHDPVLLSGVQTFTVTADNGSFIALTVNGEIIGTAQGTGNPVNISIAPQMPGDVMIVTVTKQNYYRYSSSVNVIPPSGPYVTFDAYIINDALGNDNGLADYGEDITLHMTLENLGSATATGVTANVISSDANISITGATATWPDIPAGSTSTVNDAFAISINDLIPDQHVVLFELQVTGADKDTWTSYFTMTLNAPVLDLGNMVIDDIAGGNGNGRLDPGETADLYIPNINSGHSDSPYGTSTLVSTDTYVTVNSGNWNVGVIPAGTTVNAIFNISIDPMTPIGHVVDLVYDMTAGAYPLNKTYYQSVGLILEDWETGDFSRFFWGFGGNADWQIETAAPYEGIYCAKSGPIGNSQKSELIVQMDVATSSTISFFRKVSSEVDDYLRFYIDGTMQGQWSGTVAWGEVSYTVGTGIHQFKWSYEKDASTATGSDAAWVDYIIFPPLGAEIPQINVSTNMIDFENVFVGDLYTKTFTVTNSGTGLLTGSMTTPVDVFTVGCQGGKNTYNYEVLPGFTTEFEVTFAPVAIQTYSGDMTITHNVSGGGTELIFLTGNGISGLPLPYDQPFEEAGGWPYAWNNVTGDDFDWTMDSGGTPSSGTGPSGDHTTGSGYYVFTESSSPNYPSKLAILETPVFDLAGATVPTVSFWYHMYGTAMGQLHLDILSGGVWTNDVMSPISGNQGNQWNLQVVDLTGYTGTVKFRFRGITGTSYTSDMAIDDFSIFNNTGVPTIVVNPTSLNFGPVWVGNTANLQFTIENNGQGTLSGDITTPAGYSVAEVVDGLTQAVVTPENNSDNVITYSVPFLMTKTFAVTFAPSAAQSYDNFIVITSNDPNNPTFNLDVFGSGVNPPDIDVNPTSFTVTLPPDGTTHENFYISNLGDVGLDFTIITMDADETGGKMEGYFSEEQLQMVANAPDMSNQTDELDPNAVGEEQFFLPPIFKYGDNTDIEEVFGAFTSTFSGGDRDRGNIFHVTQNTMLSEQRMYLNIPTSTELYFFVYEGTATTGTFTKIAEKYIASSGTGTGWYSSGTMIVSLQAGKYYYIGTAWLGSVTYGRGSQSVPIPCSFGELTTGIPGNIAGGFPPAATASSTYTNFSPYYQTIVTGPVFTWLTPTPSTGQATGGGSVTIDLLFDATGLAEGTYMKNMIINSNDPDEPTVTVPVTLIVMSGATLDIKAFLEGPFNGTNMPSFLNVYGYVPLAQPYNMPPWNYTGTEAVAAIPSQVVDWVLVELRDAPDAPGAVTATIIERQAAFILENGSVVGLDGTSLLNFTSPVTQNLFVVLRHRNHLGIMSADPVVQTGGVFTIDFTSTSAAAYNGMLAQNEVAAGVWGMAGGDGDGNGQVSIPDKVEVWLPQSGTSGYLGGDFDMNGTVDNADKLDVWAPNSGKGAQIPY
ncbi:MAG: choice-of-anchor D domain-containing protein [Bacteroidales bacterium]|nr:choice-of-anchor D domain-containing protein [Bacteroidales bacterium]